jgi:hypothetical protein
MSMPKLVLALALAAAPLAAAAAGPGAPISSVDVTIGAPLQANAQKYGERDLDYLARELKTDVERSLRSQGRLAPGGARLRLVIVDAVPNRPTFAQLGANPSLSMRSVAVGGATIDGEQMGPGGHHVHYQWYETDIRLERGSATWSDAERAFDMFAHDFASGRL